MKQIPSYQAGSKLFNYASWNLLISCFSSFAGSVWSTHTRVHVCVRGSWSLCSMSCFCLLAMTFATQTNYSGATGGLTVRLLLWGFRWVCHSSPGRVQFPFKGNQNARASQAACSRCKGVYNLTQTSVLESTAAPRVPYDCLVAFADTLLALSLLFIYFCFGEVTSRDFITGLFKGWWL